MLARERSSATTTELADLLGIPADVVRVRLHLGGRSDVVVLRIDQQVEAMLGKLPGQLKPDST